MSAMGRKLPLASRTTDRRNFCRSSNVSLPSETGLARCVPSQWRSRYA